MDTNFKDDKTKNIRSFSENKRNIQKKKTMTKHNCSLQAFALNSVKHIRCNSHKNPHFKRIEVQTQDCTIFLLVLFVCLFAVENCYVFVFDYLETIFNLLLWPITRHHFQRLVLVTRAQCNSIGSVKKRKTFPSHFRGFFHVYCYILVLGHENCSYRQTNCSSIIMYYY